VSDGKLLPFRRIRGTAEEMSDRALVSALAQSDTAALGALYDRFHADVYRFLVRISRADVAEDLAQQTFLEAYRSAPRFRGESTVKTWLFGIAVNQTRNYFRSESRRANANSKLAAMPPARPPSVNEALTIEQQRSWVAAAVEQLSPGLREAYVLCVVEEVPGKEAARILGIREASLWRRLSDARNALRAAIEEMQS
jgi:RNA polymerase sigma-70 factor (ECF subfamily)